MVAGFEKFKHGREHVGVLELHEEGEQHTAVGLPHAKGFQIFLPTGVARPHSQAAMLPAAPARAASPDQAGGKVCSKP